MSNLKQETQVIPVRIDQGEVAVDLELRSAGVQDPDVVAVWPSGSPRPPREPTEKVTFALS